MSRVGPGRHSGERAATAEQEWRAAAEQGKHQVKHNVILTITSLLSILFMTFRLSDDIVRGMESGGVKILVGVLILVVWLYGTLMLAGRRSGYVIILLGSILGSGVPVVHMRGTGVVGGAIANSSGVFFWVWTLIALGVTASFSAILSARGLWSLRRAN
ncbi:MAG: hypothetical protein ACRD2T_15730 [Thermoanaerobaculia bacterium]